MAVHDEFEEPRWVGTRESRIKKHPKDLDQFAPGPAMMDTLLELAATIVGFLGVMFLIFACVRALGYN